MDFKKRHSIRSHWLTVVGCGIACLLAACTPMTLMPSGHPPKVHQPFELQARIAAKTGEKGSQFTVRWQQNGPRYLLRVSGPLGVMGGEMTGDATSATLKMANGERITATDPEQLILDQTGFALPIRSLSYWIRGLPLPKVPKQTVTQTREGIYTTFTQRGWQVEYLEYTVEQGIRLPKRLTLSCPPLHAYIQIDRWILP